MHNSPVALLFIRLVFEPVPRSHWSLWYVYVFMRVCHPPLVTFSVSVLQSFWLQQSRRCSGFTGNMLPPHPTQHPPPSQLFNYPGLLILPGTWHSAAEPWPGPVNDWLFLLRPLGMSAQCGDRRSLSGPCSAAAHPLFTSSPDCTSGSK